MAKEKKQRADKYEEKLQVNKTFAQLIRIAANPKDKGVLLEEPQAEYASRPKVKEGTILLVDALRQIWEKYGSDPNSKVLEMIKSIEQTHPSATVQLSLLNQTKEEDDLLHQEFLSCTQ